MHNVTNKLAKQWVLCIAAGDLMAHDDTDERREEPDIVIDNIIITLT